MTAQKKLDQIREKLTANAQAQRVIGDVQLSEAETEQRLRDWLRDRLHNYDPAGYLRSAAYPNAIVSERLAGFEGVVALLGEDVVIARYMDLLRADDHFKPGPDPDQRAAERQRLSDERWQLELAEERECLRLEAQGFSVTRRPDLNPDAVLTVWNEQDDAA